MSGDLTAASETAERRTFFRVDDSVSLSYHQVSEKEMDERMDRVEMELEGNFTVMSSIASINQNMAGIMHRIEGDEPDIAEYLKAINTKIEILGRALLSKDSDLVEQPAQPVNLSASGMAFYSSEPLEKGALLELRLLLMPSFTGIITFGEVVGSDSVDDAEGYSFFIRLNFIHMRENDRDLLIRHVIKRQGEYLRKRRENREAE
jgi:c-di-GMP-binding flagellar brake protein YcgR